MGRGWACRTPCPCLPPENHRPCYRGHWNPERLPTAAQAGGGCWGGEEGGGRPPSSVDPRKVNSAWENRQEEAKTF